MIKRVIFLITLVLMTACSQSQDADKLSSINIIDRNGMTETITTPERLKNYETVDFEETQPYQKVLRVYDKDSQGNTKAVVTSYHPNGQVKQYLEVLNSRAYGPYREWHSNGHMKLDTFVIGGLADLSTGAENSWLFDGCARVWDDEGRPVAEINYVKGELEGPSIYFHDNGRLWKNVSFYKGKIEGTFEIYKADGALLQTTEYTSGKKQGKSLRYWQPNQIASEEIFHEDRLMIGRYYGKCGTLISQINDGTGYRAIFGKESFSELHEYQKGQPEGKVKIFAIDGTLVREYHVRDGQKHGDETEYYPGTMQPKLMINWYNGIIQGTAQTWYDNGNRQSQREMSQNKKNGLSTAWYKNGGLMMIEEYDQDKLIKGEYFKRGHKVPISGVDAGEGVVTLFDEEGNFVRKTNYHQGKPEA